MSGSARPVALAAASARSMSAISASPRVRIHEGSLASASPRQALGPVIGFIQIELIAWSPPSLMPRVEGVAQTVAEDVERHDDEEYHQARIERHPRRLREIPLG